MKTIINSVKLVVAIVLVSTFKVNAQQSILQPGDYNDGIYVKENSNHLISNSSGVYYSEESKINSTDNIYTTNGFVKIINTTYPTKYYKTYKTIFDNYYIPTDTTVTSRFNSDFTETDSITSG